jgi:tol-pal system protein YbgF
LAAAALAACLAFGPGTALAQQDGPAAQEPQAAPAGQPKAPAGDSGGDRLGQVEEQLNDLRVMIGALESLVKAKPDAVLPQEGGHGAAGQGDVSARVDALEAQISTLTSQLEQMTQQLSAMQAKLSGKTPPAPSPAGGAPGRQGSVPPAAPDTALAGAGGSAGTSPSPDDVLTASDGDPAALTAQGGAPEPLPPISRSGSPGGAAAEGQPQSLVAALPDANATAIYNQGYGDLLRRDYAAAQTAFGQLVNAYPDDPLAGKAQYWLGETYYVRAQYKDAAEAFLKGYKRYKAGEKAPDSLLKLAMSLAALGQKQEACSAFGELGAKFPTADERLRDEAKNERRKAGC